MMHFTRVALFVDACLILQGGFHAASAQAPITVLHDFGAISLNGGLVQAPDGTFYGTSGDILGIPTIPAGAIFHMTTSGQVTILYQFPADGSQGLAPNALIQASDGNFYGTNMTGGSAQAGTAFRLGASGQMTIIHVFQGSDGSAPSGRLVEGIDGSLYGATLYGGSAGQGTIFQITRSGMLNTIVSFSGANGSHPNGGLVPAGINAFYGSTLAGGAGGGGTIFKVTTAGALQTLYSFSGVHGCPSALTPASDGNLYGTTADITFFPASCFAAVFGGFGSIFRITPKGAFSNLHSMGGNGLSPAFPSGPLLQASDGNFYGVSNVGGSGFLNPGTIFRYTPAGQLTWSSFQGGSQGASPCCELVQAAAGGIYGVTQGFVDIEFGPEDAVTYVLTAGLPKPLPVIAGFRPVSGPPGTVVTLFGEYFISSSAVNFNGIPAGFRTMSSGAVVTVVPAGATSGTISLTTAAGTALSRQSFTVTP